MNMTTWDEFKKGKKLRYDVIRILSLFDDEETEKVMLFNNFELIDSLSNENNLSEFEKGFIIGCLSGIRYVGMLNDEIKEMVKIDDMRRGYS